MAVDGADAGARGDEAAFARARAVEGLPLAGLREELPCLDLEALDFSVDLGTVSAACGRGAMPAPAVDGLGLAWSGSLAMLTVGDATAAVVSTVGSSVCSWESCINGAGSRGHATGAPEGIVCGDDGEGALDDLSDVGAVASIA